MADPAWIDQATAQRLMRMLAAWESDPERIVRGLPGTSTHPLPPVSLVRWGKTDSNVSGGGTVTVSIWQTTGGGWQGWDEDSTQNIEGVKCPPTHNGLPSGVFCQIGRMGSEWFILAPHIIAITGLAKGAVATSDATFTMDNVETLSGPDVVADAAATVTVRNLHDWEIDDNGEVDAIWNGENESWDAWQATCPV